MNNIALEHYFFYEGHVNFFIISSSFRLLCGVFHWGYTLVVYAERVGRLGVDGGLCRCAVGAILQTALRTFTVAHVLLYAFHLVGSESTVAAAEKLPVAREGIG